MTEDLYYAKGDVVHKRPVKVGCREEGTSRITMGFPVCTASEWVSAEDIAKALTLAEGADQ